MSKNSLYGDLDSSFYVAIEGIYIRSSFYGTVE